MSFKTVSTALESNPALGWFGATFAWLGGVVGWLISHAGPIATVVGAIFGCGAAILGFIAGWYTVKIQRRTWKKGDTTRHPYLRR